jgi:hypothetical protein
MTLARYTKARNRKHDTQSNLGVRTGQVNKDPKVREQQRVKARRRAAFCALFTKVDSIVAGRDVPVRLATDNWTHDLHGQQSPVAWTDGETIWVSRGRFDKLMFPSGDHTSNLQSIDALSALKGLNYHELAHVLFTPRNGHKPLPQIKALQKSCDEAGPLDSGHEAVITTKGNALMVRSSDIWHSFNVLEDQRIETLFTAKWVPAVPYFVTAITQFILKNMRSNDDLASESSGLTADAYQDLVALTHVLTHGRQYLPASVRSDLRRVCVGRFGELEVAAVDALIDEYRFLVFPADGKRAVEIIKAFAIWLKRHTDGSGPEGLTNPTGGHEHIRDGKADAASGQRSIRDRAEEISSSISDEVDESDQKRSDDATDSGAGSAQDGEGNHGKPDDDGISDTGDGSGDQSGSGDSSGAGQEAARHPDQDEIFDSLDDLLRDSSKDILTDVIDTIKTMNDYEDEIISRETTGIHAARQFTAPSHQETQTRRRLSQSLEQLRSDAEPQWVKRVDSGRINVPALMANRGVNMDIFDSWTDAGDDATSIEVVILLDQSSSMYRRMSGASGAMWVIKGACDDLEIPCSVIGYSGQHALLLGRDDLVDTNKVGRFPSLGSTDPRGALEEAHRIFAGSDRRHKLLFSVTDGEWFHLDVCSQMVKEISDLGVHTDLIYLTANQDADGLDHLSAWMKERRWNGHNLGAIATSLPAMVRHIDKALAGVMLDVIADAV